MTQDFTQPPASSPEPPKPQPPHVCFSGTVACSGCNTCMPCREVQRTSLVPAILMASGINDIVLAYYDLLVALERAGVDPARQLGVRVVPITNMQEMVMRAFGGFQSGWAAIHQRMQHGDLRGLYAIQRVVALPDPVPEGAPARAGVPVSPAAYGVGTAPVAVGSPPAAREAPTMAEQLTLPVDPPPPPPVVDAPPPVQARPEPQSNQAPPQARSLVRPFEVDELARAIAAPAEMFHPHGGTNGIARS